MERLTKELEELFIERMENENPDYEVIDDEDFEPAQEAIPTTEKIHKVVLGKDVEFEQISVVKQEL